MKVSLKKRILAVIACTCAFCFLCQTSVSYADNLDKLKGQSSDLKNELSNINQELLDIGKQIADNEVKMESMEGDIAKTQEQLAIAKNNEKAQYDAACKRLLSEKIILAWIMKECLEEYRDYDVKEIVEKYIEGEPQVSTMPVMPDATGTMIRGMNAEDTSLHEGIITYSIYKT